MSLVRILQNTGPKVENWVTAGLLRRRLARGGFGICALLGLMFPALHLGNTSYTPQAASIFNALDTSACDRIIEVDLRKLFLVLRDQDGAEIRRYPVAGPRPKDIPKPLLKKEELVGSVQRIIIDPWWYPTAETREDWQAKGRELSERVPPCSPLNAMGKAKIILKFAGYPEPLRIHGTNQPRSIGRHASRGCIRMHNRDILELTGLLQQKKCVVVFRYDHMDVKASNQPDSKI
jgi:lipoprotein-anchoring transpeptidase ErfK/SrfK